MKRILHIIADGTPGGGTSNVLALCQGLKSKGYEIAFVTQKDSYSAAYASEVGLQSYGVEFFASRLDPRIPFRLKRIILEVKPDLVHVHCARAGLPYTFTGIQGIPTAYSIRGYHFQQKRWPIKQLAILAEKRVSSRADITVFVAEADREISRQYGILPVCPQTRVIYNGLDISKVPEQTKTKPGKIAFLGRITYQKDPLLFLDVMKILAKHNFTAVMIGGGEMEDEVRAKIQANGLEGVVEMRGSLAHQEALQAITDAEIMLMTTRWEGLPLAPIEAMCMGIPVVAPAVNGIPEIIQNNENGVLVYDRNPQSYADAVLNLLNNNDVKANTIASARKTVVERFTLDRVIQEHLDMYKTMFFSSAR
ncbi:MAG: glycosyltransferase [Planctomycetes bacterium]|nr:glycosyltransferase [Planctomycetota bacterium]